MCRVTEERPPDEDRKWRWRFAADSLQRLVLGADVEADQSTFDGERVHAVVLDQHLGVLRGPQLDERLDGHMHTVT